MIHPATSKLRPFFIFVAVILAFSATCGCHKAKRLGSIFDAAKMDDVSMLRAIVQQNPERMSSRDSDGNTPLHLAASDGRMGAANLLLTRNAEIDPVNRDKATPLHLAAGNGHLDMVVLLLAHGAKVNVKDDAGHTPLSEAAEVGQLDVVKVLILAGADVNAGGALIEASGKGFTDIVNLLLSKGAKVNEKDGAGRTALAVAIQSRQSAVVDLLRRHGAR